MNDKKGFTLVEVMIALFVTSIILSAVYYLFINVSTMNKQQTDFIQIQDSLRTVSLITEKDIRRSPQKIEITTNDNTTTLYYLDEEGNKMIHEGKEVKYIYRLENGRLYRNDAFIMENLTKFELSQPQPFYVQLNLMSKIGNREVKHDQKIYLR